jgi:hypothetical protein
MKTKWMVSVLILLTSVVFADEEGWRSFGTPTGVPVMARVVSTDINGVRLELKDGGKVVDVPYTKLSPTDRKYVQDWTLTGKTYGATKPQADVKAVAKDEKIYPYSWADVEKYIQAIKDRDPEAGEDRQVQKAINELNIYRFLCGVSWKVDADEGRSKSAERAARVFVEEGEYSREVDDMRDKYLWEEREDELDKSVKEFIADESRDNRDTLPMRSRVLSPGLTRSGFGKWENVCAMWADGASRSGGPKTWSYPGRGFFPHAYLHGDSWSLYVDYRIPDPEKVKVEMWELASAPEAPFAWDKPVPGQRVDVTYVAVHENAVHFQPGKPGKKSIYWVRVTGTGIQEQYLVHFY